MKCPKCSFVANHTKPVEELHPVNDSYVYRRKTPLMVSLLVEQGFSRVPHTARVCMWMKVHPHFSTIRTGKQLQFKYVGREKYKSYLNNKRKGD